MNITRENIDELNAVVKVEIEKDDYNPKVEKVLKDYRKNANIPGFRKGHVPMGLIKKQYGQAVLVDEVNKLLQENLNKYLTEEKLDVLGNPLPKEQEDLYNLTLNSIQEIRARGGFVLGIRFSDNSFPKDLLSDEIILPSASIFQAPFLHLLSGQLLSYYMAVGLKRNVDRPRSLAKSVTVA